MTMSTVDSSSTLSAKSVIAKLTSTKFGKYISCSTYMHSYLYVLEYTLKHMGALRYRNARNNRNARNAMLKIK